MIETEDPPLIAGGAGNDGPTFEITSGVDLSITSENPLTIMHPAPDALGKESSAIKADITGLLTNASQGHLHSSFAVIPKSTEDPEALKAAHPIS